MAIGDVFQGYPRTFLDPQTGYRILQPIRTDGNRHMYFTSNPFTGVADEVLFSGVRGGCENYYLLNFLTGEYRQLTDLAGIRTDRSYFDRSSGVLYYGDPHHIFGVNIRTLETKLYYETDEALGSLAVTCDGRYLITFAKTSMIHHGNDAEDVFEIPMWRIFRLELQTGLETTIAYRSQRIDHIQCSPGDPNWFMYCVWGYHCTHQRIWRCNLDGTDGGPIGLEKPNEHRTHEYFTANGQQVAFHGKYFTYGDTPAFTPVGNTWGVCSFDGREEKIYRCVPSKMQAGHSIMSHNGRLIAADGGDCVSLIELHSEDQTCTFSPIARHDSSMCGNFVHPHPSFSYDDRYVIFATDHQRQDRGNIYLVDLQSR